MVRVIGDGFIARRVVVKGEVLTLVSGPYIDTGTETILHAKEWLDYWWVGREGGSAGRVGVLGVTSKVCRAGAWVPERSEGHSVP